MLEFNKVKYKDIINIENLNIKKHIVTTIIGKSGSGKTTLLRLLNKLTSCDSGYILYNRQNINDINSVKIRREIVMLPQNPAIFNGTLKDNLLIGLKFSEKPMVSDASLLKTLKMVSLDKQLEQSAEKLSGGEKQKLALGRVILMKPEVLLLDEPSSALDEETELLIIEQIVNYTKNNNKTLVMVTHSKKIAKQFSDEIINLTELKKVSKV